MCNFSDKLNELRQHKVLGISIVDTAGTVAIGYAASKILDTDPLTTIIVTFVLGEAVHMYFDIDTPITKLLKNISPKDKQSNDIEYY